MSYAIPDHLEAPLDDPREADPAPPTLRQLYDTRPELATKIFRDSIEGFEYDVSLLLEAGGTSYAIYAVRDRIQKQLQELPR